MISIILNEIPWNGIENMKIHYTSLGKCCGHSKDMEQPPDLVQMWWLMMPHMQQESMKKYMTHITGFLGRVEKLKNDLGESWKGSGIGFL